MITSVAVMITPVIIITAVVISFAVILANGRHHVYTADHGD
jgi:hypothetical protein